MEEFNDIDKEIAKLRLELSKPDDEWTREFHLPAAGDYWKKRLDEEKTLWDKKMQAKAEEMKNLQDQLTAQSAMMEKYNASIKELERKMTEDTSRWDERLKAKETELLLEKNRLLWEEKIKQSENENHSLLEKVSDLNEKIGGLKDEQLRDRERLVSVSEAERKAFDEKLAAYQNQVETFTKRSAELEESLKSKTAELERVSKQLSDITAESKAAIEKLSAEKSEALKSKEEVYQSAQGLIKTLEAEKKKLAADSSGANKEFLKKLHTILGPLTGLVRLLTAYKLKESAWKPVKEALQKLEGEVEGFSKSANLPFTQEDVYTLGVCTDAGDAKFFDEVAANGNFMFVSISPKAALKDVLTHKPQMLGFSARYYKQALKVKSEWPFMPVTVFGDIKPSAQRALEAKGIEAAGSPFAAASAAELLKQAAYHSVSWPEYWYDIKPRRRFFNGKFIAVCGALFLAVLITATKFTLLDKISSVKAYALPYPEPANITVDGGKLWSCDWMGQSVYLHNMADSMRLEKIYYFPDRHFSSIVWIKGELWSADSLEKKIYRHNQDERLTIAESFPAPGAAPSGLCGDGEYLYSCDSSMGLIYRHRFDKVLSVDRTFKSPGSSPSGLYCDGRNIWSVDSVSNRIYCHSIDADLTVEKIYAPAGLEQKGFSVTGIAVSKDKVWLSSEKTGSLIEITRSSLARVQ